MAQTIDFYIDVTNGTLVAAGAARNGSLPTFTRNDSYNFRVRLQERDTSGFLRDLNTSGSSVKLGIGGIDDSPTDGSFKLVLNSVTSSAIPYNATAVCVYNAISAIASTSVSVTTYGSEASSFLITSATANSAMSFGGSSFTLFPTSSVIINTRRFPATSVSAQQVVRLIRNPAVYADTFVASPTAGIVALTTIQEGSATKNETYNLAIGADAEGGSVVLNYGTNSTTAIPIGSNATSFQEALQSITAISNGNVSVDIGNNAGNYIISFVRDLGLQNITTAFTLDASGVIFGSFLQTTVTLATAELDELFAEAGTDTITPTIEIELTQSGTPKTVLQSSITVRRDLITTGSVVPADQASYLTSAESYAAFVRNSTTGVNSTAGGLADSSAVTAVNYGGRTLNNSAGTTVLSYGAGLAFSNTPMGFYGASVTAKPANTNVVSALVSLGLIANTVTIGVAGGGSVTFPTVALTGSAITVTDNIPFVFGTTNGSKFGTATAQKISFYNSTPIVQPDSTTVVSALVNLGLIASTVTLGLPTNVVTDWTGNVSATTRFLADSSAVTSVDWGNRVLKTSTGATSLNWETGSFGSGSTVVTIAANNVAISGSYYIAMGTGNGAFRTLSTTTSVTFGTVNANDQHYRDVVVTGAAVNDIVLVGLPSAISAGAVIQGVAYKNNTVCLSCVNADTASIDVNTATYRITVLNYQ